jgi:hypothetical protein
MPDFAYQTTEELSYIDAQLIVPLTQDDPVFQLFPMVNTNSDRLVWEQRDSYRGLQAVRGLNGEPPRVVPLGASRFAFEPGVYGEYMSLDEMELTRRAAMGNMGRPADVSDLVSERQEQLLVRQTNRMRHIVWELLVNGRFVVLNDAGAIVHADAYDQQTFTASVTWATSATATPIGDFRSISVLPRGTSANLGASATAWMNQLTFNDFIENTNPADLGGRKTLNQNVIQGVEDANAVMLRTGLPGIRIYDEGYLDAAGTWQPWIPNNKVVVIGKRNNNAPLGEFRLTRNANNPGGAPGPYNKVIDHMDRKVPRDIEVHRGFNGGAIIWYPGAICVMNV